jgi:ParB family chromosome partitioning protein
MPEDVIRIPLRLVRPNPYQPRARFSEEALAELAETIRVHGVIQPILVRRDGDRYLLVAGERRLRAAERAGLQAIPAIVREVDERQMLEMALVENLQREEINPVEAARAYQRLAEEFGLTQAEIAQRAGKSRAVIANTLRLLQLPESVLQEIESGELSEGHARALLLLPEPKDRLALCEHILRNGLSVREAERAAQKHLGERRRVSRETALPTPPSDPVNAALEERLRRHFATKVRLEYKEGAGAITIEFYNDDDLARVLELLGVDD